MLRFKLGSGLMTLKSSIKNHLWACTKECLQHNAQSRQIPVMNVDSFSKLVNVIMIRHLKSHSPALKAQRCFRDHGCDLEPHSQILDLRRPVSVDLPSCKAHQQHCGFVLRTITNNWWQWFVLCIISNIWFSADVLTWHSGSTLTWCTEFMYWACTLLP
jgi:hypothetical protein